MIATRFGLPTASPGAMLREERLANTELGRKAAGFTEKGLLAPDELIVGVVRAWLGRQAGGFVFDGFPRTLGQADALDGLLAARQSPIEMVFTLDAPVGVLEERVARRLVCPKCGAIFAATREMQDAAKTCDRCGEMLTHRPDDTLETLQLRLAEYAAKSALLIDCYEARGVLRRIEAERPADAVFADIARLIQEP